MTGFRRGSKVGGLLLETLLALSLGVLVLGASFAALTSALRWSRVLAGRSEAIELVRTVWWILDEELRPGVVGRDWTPISGTALRLRAFRGLARVCGLYGGAGGVVVAYRGRRAPDPGSDSLLILGLDGGWRAYPLIGSAPIADGGCAAAPGEAVLLWNWIGSDGEEHPAFPVLARLFENGEYHLADRAFRYRTGGGGRQPLTPERIGGRSGFRALSNGIEVHIEFMGDPRRGDLAPFSWSVIGQNAGDGS